MEKTRPFDDAPSMSVFRRARSEDEVTALVLSRREGGFGGALRARVTGMTRRTLSVCQSSGRAESAPSTLEITTCIMTRWLPRMNRSKRQNLQCL